MESYFEESESGSDLDLNTTTQQINYKKFYLKLKLDLNIDEFITDIDGNVNFVEMIYYNFNNPNKILLIIEDMSLGIIMTKHIANKFQYIKNILEYSEKENMGIHKDYTYQDYPIKIIKIDKEWDTSKWSIYKIKRLIFDNIFQQIEQYSLEEIEIDLKQDRWYKSKICMEFLYALSWYGGDKKVINN